MKGAEGGCGRADLAAGADWVAAGRRRREVAVAGEDRRETGAREASVGVWAVRVVSCLVRDLLPGSSETVCLLCFFLTTKVPKDMDSALNSR